MKKIFSFSLFTFLNVAFSFAQNVAINADGSLPNSSAMLDVKSTNKGMLLPRVALTSTTDATTISSPEISLMVYNTTAAGFGTTAVVPGYYFWNGSTWARVVSTPPKVLIPFASGGSVTITTQANGVSGNVGLIGFGNSGIAANSFGSINVTTGPNYSFVVPSTGTITDISGFFSTAQSYNFPTAIMRVTCKVYVSPFGNFFGGGTSVTLSPDLTGSGPTGTIVTGSSSGLNIPVTAGSRITLVVSVTDMTFAAGVTSVQGYFSGGINMVLQ